MEFLFELILELVLDSSIEASQNPRVPQWLRYILMIMITLFFLCIVGLILFVGIMIFQDNRIAGILFILLGVFLAIMTIIKFKKLWLKRQ